MFEIHIGSTPCQLEPRDYRTLADKTEGYSGSDISTLVHDALMQPIRKVIGATHFKRAADPNDGQMRMWTPCSPGDPDAIEKSWQDVATDELLEPPLRVGDFLKSLESTRPTVTESDIKKHDQWTRESGKLQFLTPRNSTNIFIQVRTAHRRSSIVCNLYFD